MQAKIGHEVQAAGYEYVKLAKRDLVAQSSDTGGLLNSTIVQPVDAMNIDVRVEKFYAAFIEFGTKGKYKAIPGTEEIAAKMRGYKRGNFKDMVKAIKAWVLRKKIVATYSIKTRRKRKAKVLAVYKLRRKRANSFSPYMEAQRISGLMRCVEPPYIVTGKQIGRAHV